MIICIMCVLEFRVDILYMNYRANELPYRENMRQV